MGTPFAPVEVFYASADEDAPLLERLEDHLSVLRYGGQITTWHRRQIIAGSDWQVELDQHLNTASLILLLISSDFLASDYQYGVELQRAMQRHDANEARVIPIVLRACDWEDAPFRRLQVIPRNGKAITSWRNRDEAFAEIAREIRVALKAVQQLPVSTPSRASPISVTPAQQNRIRFLSFLHTRYTDVLEHSLQGAALMALGLTKKSDAISHPSQLIFRSPHAPERFLPTGTSILQAYDEAKGELLILGEPGAGKTTLLIDLAQALLARAEQDEHHSVPVIFNLSTWAVKRPSLAEWLIEELHDRYIVPRRLSQTLVHNEQILPLLDGLDEVTLAARSACIDAINAYRQEHLMSLVVCSRGTDYLAQQQRLFLQSAVVIQPLTKRQVEDYLAAAGKSLVALRSTLRHNSILHELATSPLMLNILTLAYRDVSVRALPKIGTQEDQQRRILRAYVQRMLEQQGTSSPYTPQQIQRWLSWLAQQMRQHDQYVFYLEHLQPSWLSSSWMLRAYDRWGVRGAGILIGILVSLTINVFFNGTLYPRSYIVSILLGGLLGGLLCGGSATQQSLATGGRTRSNLGSRLLQRLGIGIFIGLGCGLIYGLTSGPIKGLIYALIFGFCSILLQVLIGKSSIASQTLPGRRGTSWRHLIRNAGARNGILVGLLVGLSYVLSIGLGNGLSHGPVTGLVTGLAYGLVFVLLFGLSGGFLSVLLIEMSIDVQPTDRLVWSLRSLRRRPLSKLHVRAAFWVTIFIGLSYGLIDGLATGLIVGQTHGLTSGLSSGLSEGFSNGLSNGLFSGLFYWFLLGLLQGVSGETIKDQHRVVPNQGIRHSAFSGLQLGLFCAIVVGVLGDLSWLLSAGLSNGMFYELFDALSNGLHFGPHLRISLSQSDWLIPGLIMGLSEGLLVGLLNGGLACFRHYVLRFLLWRAGLMPWNYIRLLDDGTRRILLRKEGGGYIFIHRLFRDYFADLDPDTFPASSMQTRPPNPSV